MVDSMVFPSRITTWNFQDEIEFSTFILFTKLLNKYLMFYPFYNTLVKVWQVRRNWYEDAIFFILHTEGTFWKYISLKIILSLLNNHILAQDMPFFESLKKTWHKNVLSLCNSHITLMSNSHRESVQRTSLSQLQL